MERSGLVFLRIGYLVWADFEVGTGSKLRTKAYQMLQTISFVGSEHKPGPVLAPENKLVMKDRDGGALDVDAVSTRES
jgi:hypothetical protein